MLDARNQEIKNLICFGEGMQIIMPVVSALNRYFLSKTKGTQIKGATGSTLVKELQENMGWRMSHISSFHTGRLTLLCTKIPKERDSINISRATNNDQLNQKKR